MKMEKKKVLLTIISASILVLMQWSGKAQTTAPASQSTIHGRAIYQDTERPIRRASVVLISDAGSSESRSTVTDSRGEFTYKNVPAGRYYVVVNSPGYLNGFPQIDLNNAKRPT